MSLSPLIQNKSLHRLVFDHYLRTGEQLTEQEWLARQQSKFNPYHDELGRFSSPPGVTVSWGNSGGPRAPQANGQRRNTKSGRSPATPGTSKPTGSTRQASGPAAPGSATSAGQFRSDFVRNAVSPQSSHAETYFELNKRQAYLNQLRSDAGPSADAVVKADLDDFQRRLDSDRQRLNARAGKINAETAEILRAGLAPVDVGIGAINIASGNGEVRDYFAVAGAIPLGATIKNLKWLTKLPRATVTIEGATREIVQLGGPHWKVRLLPKYHSHHMPSKGISPLREGEGPAIAILPKDHKATLSFGNGPDAIAHRLAQAELIAKGDFRGAQQLDIDEILTKFPGRYDGAIEQMLKHMRDKGL